MFTVAIIGCDGSGKSTVTNELLQSQTLRFKYLYMGMSTRSSNIALPTSRLLKFFREYRFKRANQSSDISDYYESKRGRDHRGKIGATLRLFNRIAEECFRQLISWSYQLRGYNMLYDRHFIFEYAPNNYDPPEQQNRLSERLHRWFLNYLYVKPDLVIFLDAPPEVLFARKGEATFEYLASRRQAYLNQGEKAKSFIRIDATQPLELVLDEVKQHIVRFQNSKIAVNTNLCLCTLQKGDLL